MGWGAKGLSHSRGAAPEQQHVQYFVRRRLPSREEEDLNFNSNPEFPSSSSAATATKLARVPPQTIPRLSPRDRRRR